MLLSPKRRGHPGKVEMPGAAAFLLLLLSGSHRCTFSHCLSFFLFFYFLKKLQLIYDVAPFLLSCCLDSTSFCCSSFPPAPALSAVLEVILARGLWVEEVADPPVSGGR